MSIFDDIADAGRAVAHTVAGAAEDVAHSTFGHTVEELGGAVAAPVTALLDVAQFPFEVPQKGIGNAFHQLVHNEANEGLKLVKPFTDGDTYTGKVFTGVTGAMNTAWSKAIDQPLATLAYATEHASMNGDLGEQWATLFDGSTWSKAYDIAKQDDSGLAFGKSLVPILFSDDGKDIDPFNRNDLANLQQKHQTAGNILGVGATLGIGWVADPSVVLGKTLGISMQSRYLAKLGATDRAAMLAKISPGENLTGVGAFKANRYSNRVDGHWDFISGDNKLGKPLSAMEIHASSPELQRAPSGLEIASAMSRAARQGDKQMYKMIVAATAGDPGAIMALHDQSAAGRVVADTFKNILSGGPIDLETHALNEWARFDPTMFAEYQRQLGNQDAAGDLTKFAKDWSARVDHRVADMRQVVANRGALDYVPARHDQMFGLNNPFSKSNNALKRVNEDRLIDKGAAFHDRVQERAAEIAAAPRQSLWQQGLSQVPLLLVKGTNPATGWYTGRYEKGIMDALRGQHYIGKVELHDWSGSLRQLDAMLRLSKVETAKRLQVLDIAGRAVTEGEKNQATQVAIQTAFRGLADHYSPKLGGKTIDQGFINSVVTKNMLKAKASQTAFAPQVYGATPLPQSMLDRPDIADAIAGARQQADEALANGSQEWGAEGVEHNAWRVDQVDEHGSLVSLPLFESQLRNTIMLPDLHSMDTALSREVTHHRLADWSAAWKKQADELSLLRARRMHAAGSALDRIDKLILAKQQMMDGLTDAGTLAVRAWKASVLLRLGYPQRVLADDHLRISNKLHWMREMVAPNVAEGTKNVYYNRAPAFLPGSRDAEALKAWKQARFERQQMEQALGLRGKSADDLKEISRAYDTKNMVGPVDEARLARAEKALADLDPEGHVAEWFDHRAKAKTLQRQIMGKRNAIKRWQEQVGAFEDAPPPEGLFHGTRERFPNDELGDIYSTGAGAGNLYGHGFYTTDDFGVASSYRKKGGATGAQHVYSVKWKGEGRPNLLDLDKPAHDTVKRWGQSQIDGLESGSLDATDESINALRDAIAHGTSGEVIRAVAQAYMSTGQIPKYEVDELVSHLSEMLGEEGYDGLRHVGGALVGNKKHNVSIFFDTGKLYLSNATRHRGIDDGMATRVERAQQDIARLEARRDYHISQMPDRDPFEARKEIDDLLDAERQGWRAFVPEKRRLGSKDVKLKGIDDNLRVDANATTSAEGSIGAHGKHYQALTSSEGTFDELAFGPEGRHSQDQRVGAWKTFHPTDDAYSEAWADVLNHQVRNSRLAMHILKNRDASVEDIAAWLREPEQVDLRDRVAHYAKDPLDWAGRVHALIHEYVPSDDVADLLLKGEVKPQQLERAVPTEARPVIHGKSLDYNTGRSAAAQSLGNAYRSIFKVIGEMPTDTLSRHPFFNAMYKKELQEIADTNIEYAKLTGKDRFTESDIHDWESTARRKALGHLKATLWDISAHSHAGHVMRYLSPFFTAHVESLSRWWRIAQDDPSVIRKFEMAFDAPRNLGLVYDQSTGEPVKPGDPITSNHRIAFRFPSTHIPVVDKFLKAVGGDRNLSVGENGLNIILQNGIANPGTGPMVTVPVTELAKKYASDPSITKFANMVNPYPQDSVVGGLEPSTLRKTMDYFKGLHNDTSDVAYAQAYATNLNEAIADYQRKHGGADPIGKAMDHIVDAAGKEAQHDLLIEALWSWGGFTPSRVEGKYAAIQRGWQQIQAVGRAQGKDYDWMRNKFKEKYHGAYMPMLYSSSDNPARLDSTPGTVSAVAKYRGLVKHLDDARTVRIIAGPAAAMNATHDPASGEFTKEARLWLQNQHVLGSGDALLNTRNPKQQAIAGMIGEGWDAYTQAMNQLNTAAMANGASLTSAAVQQVKQSLIAQIGAKNPQWAQDYQERIGLGNQWPSVMQDLRRIASNKALTNDPERGDVKILGDYIGLRDQVQGVLDALKAKGLPHTPGAKALAPLFQMFQQKVDQMRQDNTYFDDYTFNGLVEFDPFYRAALTGGN